MWIFMWKYLTVIVQVHFFLFSLSVCPCACVYACVHMFPCLCVYAHAYVCPCSCVHVHSYWCVYEHGNMYTYVSMCMRKGVCALIFMSVCTRACVCPCSCMYACVCMCIPRPEIGTGTLPLPVSLLSFQVHFLYELGAHGLAGQTGKPQGSSHLLHRQQWGGRYLLLCQAFCHGYMNMFTHTCTHIHVHPTNNIGQYAKALCKFYTASY